MVFCLTRDTRTNYPHVSSVGMGSTESVKPATVNPACVGGRVLRGSNVYGVLRGPQPNHHATILQPTMPSTTADISPNPTIIFRRSRPRPFFYMHQVSITAGSNLLTTYHGNLDLASCLSSVGLPIQGRKGLMKIRGLENGESCSSDVTSSDSIGSEIGGRCSRGSPEIVMLNITTTFVPHTVSDRDGCLCVCERDI